MDYKKVFVFFVFVLFFGSVVGFGKEKFGDPTLKDVIMNGENSNSDKTITTPSPTNKKETVNNNKKKTYTQSINTNQIPKKPWNTGTTHNENSKGIKYYVVGTSPDGKKLGMNPVIIPETYKDNPKKYIIDTYDIGKFEIYSDRKLAENLKKKDMIKMPEKGVDISKISDNPYLQNYATTHNIPVKMDTSFTNSLTSNVNKLGALNKANIDNLKNTDSIKDKDGYPICTGSKACNDKKKELEKSLATKRSAITNTGNEVNLLNNLDDTSKTNYLKQVNNQKCGDTMIVGWLCKQFTSTTEKQLREENFLKQIKNADGYGVKLTYKQLTKYGEIYYTTKIIYICKKEDSINECNKKIKEHNSKVKTNKNKIKLIQPSYEDRNRDKANKFLTLSNIKNEDIKMNCEGDLTTNYCKTAIDTYCKDNAHKDDCKIIKSNFDTAKGASEIKSSAAYVIAAGIFNPDQSALDAARLFGVEANYNNVPKFLRETFTSQICEAKIDGYLDKTINQGGGQTAYGSCSEVLDPTQPNVDRSQCIQVIGDIRAQRTQITPDKKTQITYSAFIRAPQTGDIKVIVAISYLTSNGILKKKLISNNISTISKNGVKNFYEHVALPINLTKSQVKSNSFKINLLAINPDRSVYVKLSTPIILQTFDDRTASVYQENLNGAGNTQGNNQANNQASSTELTSNDMLSMIG